MNEWLFILLMGVLLLAIILILVVPMPHSWTKARTPTDQREQQFTGPVFRDDDRYWYGGLFYNNPDDPAVLVPKRYGLGWTVNIGRPQGKLLLIGMLLLPVVLMILTALISGPTPIGCHPSGCYPAP